MATSRIRATARARSAPGPAAPRSVRGRARHPTAPKAAGAATARLEKRDIADNIASAQTAEAVAIEDILAGRTAGEAEALMKSVLTEHRRRVRALAVRADDELSEDWRTGSYPYRHLLSRRSYEQQKYRLQVELLKLQAWVKDTKQKIILLFEGRDAAGKGGTIKRFMEHLNPRGARVVALEKPTELERGEWYFQRYVRHLPTAGEIVMFDRSWYNRAGVERVMGFCSDEQYREFMRQAPEFERMLVHND